MYKKPDLRLLDLVIERNICCHVVIFFNGQGRHFEVLEPCPFPRGMGVTLGGSDAGVYVSS